MSGLSLQGTGLSITQDDTQGTVTSVSVTTANGVSGSVATATTTPAITITLGAITPTTVNGLTVSTTTGTLTLANGSSLVTSGANSITLTSSGATNVTLPTTGTLATRAGAEVLTSKTLGMWNYAADAGSTDDYVIALSPAATAYATGMVVYFKANTANTGAASLDVNGLGPKTIVKRVTLPLITMTSLRACSAPSSMTERTLFCSTP